MRSLVLISFALGVAWATAPMERRADCNHDNCLRIMIRSLAAVAQFCSDYTTATTTATLPAWATACSDSPSRISSGCSCVNTATSTSVSMTVTPTTVVVTTTLSGTEPIASSTSTTDTSSSTASISSSPVSESTGSPTSSSTAMSSSSTNSSPLSSSSSTSATSTPCPRTVPPPDAIVVDNSANPVPGSYTTMQQGVDALSLTSTNPQSLFIYPGSYYEQVYIPALQSNLTVQGYTTDCSSYTSNTATITYNLALLNTTSDDLTATLRSWNPNTKFYNLNLANTFGHVSHNGQNLAVSAHTGNQGYYGVQLLGYQDTLLANTGAQLYARCLIVGAVDFIFGQQATAWFENIDIRTIAAGSITASGRASASNPSWYVINNSNIDGINSSIAAGTNYLGRPWYPFARVVFQNSYLGAIIQPAGWSVWSTAVNGSTNIQNVTFAEFGNYGPGSVLEEGPRANFSEQLSAPVEIESILGENYRDEWWVDMSYM